MEQAEILNKIHDILDNYNWQEITKRVLVMHFSTIDMLKDYINYIPNTMELGEFKLMLKFEHIEKEVFPSFCLPKFHYCFMEKSTYEEYYKPKN